MSLLQFIRWLVSISFVFRQEREEKEPNFNKFVKQWNIYEKIYDRATKKATTALCKLEMGPVQSLNASSRA